MHVHAINFDKFPYSIMLNDIGTLDNINTLSLQGIGYSIYLELWKRLRHVGVRTVLCWGDKESEGFWLKQVNLQ